MVLDDFLPLYSSRRSSARLEMGYGARHFLGKLSLEVSRDFEMGSFDVQGISHDVIQVVSNRRLRDHRLPIFHIHVCARDVFVYNFMLNSSLSP